VLKRRLWVFLALFAIVAAACGGDDEGGGETGGATGGGEGLTVGVSWNNYNEERWAKWDEPAIVGALDAAGAEYISSDAGSSAEQQLTDVENLISQGADALIILAQDTEAIVPAVQSALEQLELERFDMLLIENVGNLICPASFQLGTHLSVLVASVPEGDDKPYKYPGAYRGVDALVINKIDLLPYVSFDIDHFRRGVEVLNAGLATFPLSCRTGEGLDAWLDWVGIQVEAKRRMQT